MSYSIRKSINKIRQIATAVSVVAALTFTGALAQPLLTNAQPVPPADDGSSDNSGLCESNGPINQTCFPRVAFTAPAAGATVSKTVTVSANAGDGEGIANVSFAIDGTTFGTAAGKPGTQNMSYSASLNTTKWKSGVTHTLKATATNTRHFEKSVTETVTIKNTVTPPAPNPQGTGGSGSTSCTPQDQYPDTNIIYCGLSGSSASALKDSFQNYYTNNNDNHGHTDLKQVYNAGNFDTSMFTSGTWATGTSYKNGTIVVNGVTVGTNTQISSRCFSGMSNCQPTSKYTHLTSNVYTRDATWFFDKQSDSKPTLVHFNSDGVADFAMWSECGNLLTFKPVVPKQSLECTALTFTNDGKPVSEDDTSVTYGFTASATEMNQTKGKMLIDFGDKTNSDTVNIDKSQVSFTVPQHKYVKTSVQQSLTAQIMIGVNGLAASTNPKCKLTISVKPTNKKTFACLQLVPGAPVDTTGKRAYTFTAKTQGTESAASYQFFFTNTDGTVSSTTVQSSNTATGTYTIDAKKVQTGSAYFVATSTSGLTSDKTDKNCQFSFTTQLPYTGPADMLGLVAGTSIFGTLGYQFVMRRRAS